MFHMVNRPMPRSVRWFCNYKTFLPIFYYFTKIFFTFFATGWFMPFLPPFDESGILNFAISSLIIIFVDERACFYFSRPLY